MTTEKFYPAPAHAHSEIEKAQAWFASYSIEASIDDGSLYVRSGHCMVQVTTSEISYRASLFDYGIVYRYRCVTCNHEYMIDEGDPINCKRCESPHVISRPLYSYEYPTTKE